MKFSLATATLGLIAIAQATLTPYSGYSGYSGGDDDNIDMENLVLKL